MSEVIEYIRSKIGETVRKNTEDCGGLIGLPYPYTVPCCDGIFNELYYWDTYFTNLGLIDLGLLELAKNNCDNMLYLVERYGYMPNGNRVHFLGGSQPPYLAMMVQSIYEKTGDKEWLKNSYATLKKEYAFWMTKRISPNGLNCYGTDKSEEGFAGHCEYACSRLGIESPTDKVYGGRNYFAECESGWDFSLRFDGKCTEYNAVDLNCNLYMYECFFAFCEQELNLSNGKVYLAKAKERKALMDKYLLDEERKIYLDYNYITDKKSKTISLASFQAYFSLLATENAGIEYLLRNLEKPYGLATTNKEEVAHYQWGYPNGWAPLHYLTVKGLLNYGYKEAAVRVAKKYLALVEKNYKVAGKLWEKYNVISGNLDVIDEYESPEMMGWTAGVYIKLFNFITV